MRYVVFPLSIIALASASAALPTLADTRTPPMGTAGASTPQPRLAETQTAIACRDRIERVREESGQPKLDREPASAERPYLIAAVDKRIDGCPVMQMKGNVNDLRPLPALPERRPRMEPAN